MLALACISNKILDIDGGSTLSGARLQVWEDDDVSQQRFLVEYLNSGFNVGLVSDRGTPIISDPGYELAKCAIEKSYNEIS